MNIDKPTSFGEVLQTLRKQKKIRQQALADKLSVHRNTIGAWERGDYLPYTRGTIVDLAKELRLNDAEKRQLLEASQTVLSSYWNVPYPRNPFFTGRRVFLDILHARLRSKQSVAQSQSYTLSGLGGIGKTQLALEYVYQHALDYYVVFWITAETIETLSAGFATIAAQLQLPERAEKDAEKIVHAALHWLNTHKEWLLVFDNVVSVALLKPFLPAAQQGSVLLTTQLRSVEGLSHVVELPPLSYDEGVAFLLRRAKLVDPMTASDPLPSELGELALALVKALGGLPLAIDQAGAYIERTGCRLSDYVHLFESYQISLLDERTEMADHPTSVVRTILLSFKRMVQGNEAAADLLHLCAYLAPDAIPEELFTQGASSLGSTLWAAITDPYQFNQILEEALRYSLLGRQPQNRTLSIHRLVQAVLRDMHSEAQRRTWTQRAVLALNAVFPEVEYGTWPKCERLLPHVLVCATWMKHEQMPAPQASHLLDKAGIYLRERGQYADAEPLLVQALVMREQHLGAEHPDTAESLNNLAILYRLQGKYEQAEPLYLRALSIREHLLGAEHPDTAASLNNLAILYRLQGKYGQAERLYLRALSKREHLLGASHPDTAKILNNLATLYGQQGKYEQAEPLFLRALSIREQYLGTEHPDTAASLNNLAELYCHQRKYEQAEPLYERALSKWEHHLGTEHPFIAYPLHGLAKLSHYQKKHAQAEALYQRALAIRKQRLGPTHPETQEMRQAYATFLCMQGRDVEARALDVGAGFTPILFK